jgi:hypothetical protein
MVLSLKCTVLCFRGPWSTVCCPVGPDLIPVRTYEKVIQYCNPVVYPHLEAYEDDRKPRQKEFIPPVLKTR